MFRLLGLSEPAVATCVMIACLGIGPAAAQPTCGEIGGMVDADGLCHIRSTAASYIVDLSYPVDYPDQQSLADYLAQTRDDFITFAQRPPARDWRYSLLDKAFTYQSGTPESGTESLVLRMGQDADPHPVTWCKAFNYDFAKHAAITFDTLFKPGAKPQDVIYPAVARAVQKRSGSDAPPELINGHDVSNYQNFAITDDAVIFFFGQGQIFSHADGPFEVSIPRTELASILA